MSTRLLILVQMPDGSYQHRPIAKIYYDSKTRMELPKVVSHINRQGAVKFAKMILPEEIKFSSTED